jgi:gluconate 2-dehydrogenase gamma chain
VFLGNLAAYGGTAVLLGGLPDFSAAHEHAAAQAHGAPQNSQTFTFFTSEEAALMAAVCEEIIPSDDGPGAKEAGAVFFIDYALHETEPELQPLFRSGLKSLAEAAAPAKFAHLPAAEKISLLKNVESTEFFQRAREYTIIGFLGDPKHHGNRGKVGWKYIGFDSGGMFAPPFGYYDAELLRGAKESD